MKPAASGMNRRRIGHDGNSFNRTRCHNPTAKTMIATPNAVRSIRPRGPMLQTPGAYSTMVGVRNFTKDLNLRKPLWRPMQFGGRGIPVLERGSTVDSPSNRVGSVGATDRPMALYTSRREPVTYPRGTI